MSPSTKMTSSPENSSTANSSIEAPFSIARQGFDRRRGVRSSQSGVFSSPLSMLSI